MTFRLPEPLRTLLVAVALTLVGTSHAQTAPAAPSLTKPEDAMVYRQSVFRLMEHHFRRLNSSVLGRLPADPQRDLDDARITALLVRLPFTAFVPGSDDKTLPGSRARDLVWRAAPRFHDSAQALRSKTDALPGAVQAGDVAALKKLLLETGAICRKCHEQFRNQ